MGGKCESDKEQSIGCQQTQKMDSAIREPQKNYLSFLVWIITGICLLALLIGGLFVYRTFWPNSYPKEIRMDVRVDGEETSKRLSLNTFLWIWPDIQVDLGASVSEETKAKIKLELSEALLAMEARAAAAYNEKFATLLTILTIFGIAWPVIIALLQFKFSEKELEKIEKAQDKAEESLSRASDAGEKAEDCLKRTQEAQEKIEKISQEAKELQAISYRGFSQQYYDMGQDKKTADPEAFGIFNHYFARALEFRLRSFLLDERNIMVGYVTNILNELNASQSSSSKNIVCRNELTTCKSIAGEIMRNNRGTVREEEAKNIWKKVVQKYNEFGGSPPEGGEQ